MDNNINILDELNKGCFMGIDALDYIIPICSENSFLELLNKQKKEYENLSTRLESLYHDYSDSDIHKTNTMEKMMLWYGIKKDTILDDSISNLASLLITGTNMGIVEGRKILNHKTMDKKVHKLCTEYIMMQEKYLEKLKDYL